MDTPTFTSATRHLYKPKPCPSCGQRRELGWANAGSLDDTDQWQPVEKCRNRQCAEYRDPTSL
ncbi:hypothetical protein [Micromonospora inositola]|uniref:Uncharacterized protein n=1 Tax=Micromonospora inositola TaxID=47865 RepID=A0A1C5IPI6_9ACTN|nr:hypothetical protein [Micromonospora inositola]SCG60215.1 hypothetical protein GA0070613_3213 [Micromonospora inositola]